MAIPNQSNKPLTKEGELFVAENTVNVEFKNSDARKSWDALILSHSNNEMTRPLISKGNLSMKYMQYLMKEKDALIPVIAEDVFKTCGLYEYSDGQRAVIVLAMIDCWKYGNQLSEWFKKNFKD